MTRARLKAPTLEGRKLLDHIAGLRLYLGVAERDELARQKAPQMNVDEFQKFLPYALALGVEKTWADRFAAASGRPPRPRRLARWPGIRATRVDFRICRTFPADWAHR